jgi:hypothetical protein
MADSKDPSMRVTLNGKCPLVSPVTDDQRIVSARFPFAKRDGSGRSATQRRA